MAAMDRSEDRLEESAKNVFYIIKFYKYFLIYKLWLIN